MTYSFHPEAELEFLLAIDFYEDKESGLGRDFALEINSTVERILTYPDAWPVVEEDIRRSLVKRFPFGVLYSKLEEEIVIIAVMHLNREPEYWKTRI
ncbi:MAG TPA: type II toxin-antitoxin system RelE/ParE family toxin [Ignavibacteriaceae bacterium]|nr:type II toxin-antitoxin system RelE/ParE family toxin [Ignavibacteriaceae bacterium]